MKSSDKFDCYDLVFMVSLFLLCIPAEYFEIFSFVEDQTISFRHIVRTGVNQGNNTIFPTNKIVLAVIDDEFFEKYGRFPLKRTDIARIISNLNKLGARVIGIDMLMKYKSAYGDDTLLAQVLAEAGNTVLASQALFDKSNRFQKLLYPTVSIRKASTTGYVNFTYSSALAISLNHLRVFPEITEVEDGWHFCIQLVSKYLGVEPRLENKTLYLGSMRILLDQFNDIRIDFPHIPAGYNYLHEYAGISAFEFLDTSGKNKDEILELGAWVKDKIVLLGDTSQLSNDWFNTPMGMG